MPQESNKQDAWSTSAGISTFSIDVDVASATPKSGDSTRTGGLVRAPMLTPILSTAKTLQLRRCA